MRMCMPHWNELKEAIRVRGLYKFVSKSGTEAVQRLARGDEHPEETPDPLMDANMRITMMALDQGGVTLMAPNDDGSERCPLCEVERCGVKADGHPEQGPGWASIWINECCDQIRNEFVEHGALKEGGAS